MIKKILLSAVLIVFFASVGVTACTIFENKTIKSDQQFVSELFSKDLQNGMTYSEFKTFFTHHGVELKPWRKCEETKLRVKKCEEFERIITTLKLPSNNYWLGKGDVQIYAIVNKNGTIESLEHEVYYPRYH